MDGQTDGQNHLPIKEAEDGGNQQTLREETGVTWTELWWLFVC